MYDFKLCGWIWYFVLLCFTINLIYFIEPMESSLDGAYFERCCHLVTFQGTDRTMLDMAPCKPFVGRETFCYILRRSSIS